MIRYTHVDDPTHGYSVTIPEATALGVAVVVRSGERNGIHLMHAESPDQSEVYFEVAAYDGHRPHGTLVENQVHFLRSQSSDGTMTAADGNLFAGLPATAFAFEGTLQGRWKVRRFLYFDGRLRTYRVVYDPRSALNDEILGTFRLK